MDVEEILLFQMKEKWENKPLDAAQKQLFFDFLMSK